MYPYNHIRTRHAIYQARLTRRPTRLPRMYRINITCDELDQRVDVFRRDRFDPLFEIVDVAVEGVDVELDGGELVDGGRGDSEGFLKTFEDALAVAVGRLRERA